MDDNTEVIRLLNEINNNLRKPNSPASSVGGNKNTSSARPARGGNASLTVERNMEGLASASRHLSNDFNSIGSAFKRSHTKFVDSLKAISQSAEGLMSGLTVTLRAGIVGMIGGGIVAEVIESAHGLFKTYRQLSDVGQTFGGSMIRMGEQAAAAGLPLNEFAEMLRKNSAAAAVMADSSFQSGHSLGELQKSVRNNLKDLGFYGMSLSQIADLTGEYADTVRVSNIGALRNSASMSHQVSQFAADISEFSTVTGKSRDEIAKATMDAMHDVSFAAVDMTATQREAVTRATSFLAAMPGHTGDALSKMLTQTIGRGAAYLTDEGREFASVGASQLNALVQDLADKSLHGTLTTADNTSFLRQVHQYYQENKSTLTRLSMMGNSAATRTLEYLQQMQGVDELRLGEMQRQAKVTKQFATLEDSLARLGTSFQEGLLKALQPMEDAFGKTGADNLFKQLSASFESLGESVGGLILNVFTPDNIRTIADAVRTLGTVLVWGAKIITKTLSGIGWGGNEVSKGIGGWGGRAAGTIVDVAGMAGAFLLGKFVLGRIGKAFGLGRRNVEITAKNVEINTGGSSGILQNIVEDILGNKKTPSGGLMSRAWTLLRDGAVGGAKYAAKGAKYAAKIVAKMGSRAGDLAESALSDSEALLAEGGAADVLGPVAAGAAALWGGSLNKGEDASLQEALRNHPFNAIPTIPSPAASPNPAAPAANPATDRHAGLLAEIKDTLMKLLAVQQQVGRQQTDLTRRSTRAQEQIAQTVGP